MHLFKAPYRDRNGKSRKTAKWYVEFYDHKNKRRRLSGFTSKSATQEFGRKLERLVSYHNASGGQVDPSLHTWLAELPRPTQARLIEIGLVDGRRAALGLPLLDDLETFDKTLAAKGTTAKHIRLLKTRITKVLNAAGFRHWGDISPSKLLGTLEEMRQDQEKDGEVRRGISAQTFNFYVQAMKQFCRWAMRERRIAESPIAHITGVNAKTDRRHDRRALTPPELATLIRVTADGPARFEMTGHGRALLYRFAAETGLRVGELRSLRPSSFNLDPDEPTVTVSPAYSKRRREDTIPLRGEMAECLALHVGMIIDDSPAFRLPDKPAKMLREDLAAAREEWLKQAKSPTERARRQQSEFLMYQAKAGVADFHALRHTFITNLARGGVHPKVAQDLARHSDINLTMSRYSHTELAERATALERLPNTAPAKSGQAQSPSPQDDEHQQSSGSVLGRRLGSNERIQATWVDSGGLTDDEADRAQLLAALEEVLSAMGVMEKPPGGLEPSTCGLQNRCSAN